MEIKPIATIKTDFKEKFGIPRQSGRVPASIGVITFEKEYRDENFLRGIEQFSHLWLLFDFSLAHRKKINATVRPPRLGGNQHIGVFASRSPFRPNNIGLSCVNLRRVIKTENEGLKLEVGGVDLLDGTPILDIKPYIPYADCIENAQGGYAENLKYHRLNVDFPPQLLQYVPDNKWQLLYDCIADDPRPSYHDDETSVYTISIADFEVDFYVTNDTAHIIEIKFKKN